MKFTKFILSAPNQNSRTSDLDAFGFAIETTSLKIYEINRIFRLRRFA